MSLVCVVAENGFAMREELKIPGYRYLRDGMDNALSPFCVDVVCLIPGREGAGVGPQVFAGGSPATVLSTAVSREKSFYIRSSFIPPLRLDR